MAGWGVGTGRRRDRPSVGQRGWDVGLKKSNDG